MNEDVYSNFLLLGMALIFLNSLHAHGSDTVVRFYLASSKGVKFRRILELLIWNLILFLAVAFLFGYAASFVANSTRHTYELALFSGASTLTLALAGYLKMASYVGAISRHGRIWRMHAGEAFERQVRYAIYGAYSPRGILWSMVVGGGQCLALAFFARDPSLSRVSALANSPEAEKALQALVGTGVILWVSFYLVLYLLNPSRAMVEYCLRYYVEINKEADDNRVSIVVSRWRSPEHRLAFKCADSITRSLAGLKKKLSFGDFERLDLAYRAVANSLRKRSVEVKSGELDETYASLCVAAVALAVEGNPMSACQKAEEVNGRDVIAEPKRHSKVTQSLEYVDGVLQRYSRVLLFALGVAVVVILVATGQLSQALEFLQQVVLPR